MEAPHLTSVAYTTTKESWEKIVQNLQSHLTKNNWRLSYNAWDGKPMYCKGEFTVFISQREMNVGIWRHFGDDAMGWNDHESWNFTINVSTREYLIPAWKKVPDEESWVKEMLCRVDECK